jgi:GNAT superfamily N-acetyltransferase
MHLRLATADDAPGISALIRSLSDPFFVSPGGEGAELFLHSISESAVHGYVTAESFHYVVAEANGRVVGVVAVRDSSHLFHLFVAPAFQGQGVARLLWQLASNHALTLGNLGRFTVNSSLGAIPVYERFGFVSNGTVIVKHGISFQPMLRLPDGG